MITLKSKIVRNFIAGILSCVLVFSILVTLFVTINYSELLDEMPDARAKEVSYLFKKYNNDESMDLQQMQDRLSEAADDLEVDIIFEEIDGTNTIEVFGRPDEVAHAPREETFAVVNVDRGRKSGRLHVIYNINREAIYQLQRNFSTAIAYGLAISLIIGFIISLILSQNISEPIMNMSESTVKIKDGSYVIDDEGTDIIELENLKNNINYLSKNLKNQENIRKQYAQDISHELRTPLTNLQLYIEAIRDGVIEPDQNTMDILLEDVIRLEGLIEGLKKTFDESVEYFDVKNEVFDLSQLVERVAVNFIPNAEKKKIDILTHIEDQVYINSDRDKFTQILQNLISNAIKAIGFDGEINIYLKEESDTIVLKVEDNGIGIEDDKLERIFERFYRIEDARNTKDNGHGLGLSITKNFVEALGGKITVESMINEGSTFTLTFIK